MEHGSGETVSADRGDLRLGVCPEVMEKDAPGGQAAKGDLCGSREGLAHYAFVDSETTGFDAFRHCVITMSMYITDAAYQIVDELHLRIRPDGSRDIVWSLEAQKVHGITWEEAMLFPPLETQAKVLDEFLAKHPPMTFVAHNVAFDRRMIRGMLAKQDRQWAFYRAFPRFQDTVPLVKKSGLVGGKSKSLGPICKELGIAHDHHDAKSDAFVLIELHKRCSEALGNDAEAVLTTGE
jgi:DNA polymerase III epsilon subunit-like protein